MAISHWGGESTVNTTLIGHQRHPVVAALPNGGYVVAWMDASRGVNSNDIRYQVFLADGTKVGAERLAFENTTVTQPYTLPEIAVLSDGSSSFRRAADRADGVAVSTDIARRVFAIDGLRPARRGSKRNRSARPNQITPASAPLGTGYVTVWDEQGADAIGIYGSHSQR